MNIVLFVDLSHPLLRRTFVCCRLTPREYVRTFMKGTRSSPGSTLMTLYGYKERRKKKKEKNFSPFFKRIVLVKEKLVRHAAEWWISKSVKGNQNNPPPPPSFSPIPSIFLFFSSCALCLLLFQAIPLSVEKEVSFYDFSDDGWIPISLFLSFQSSKNCFGRQDERTDLPDQWLYGQELFGICSFLEWKVFWVPRVMRTEQVRDLEKEFEYG